MPSALKFQNGNWIIEGYLPIEELERGLPRNRKKQTEHILILVRLSSRYLLRYSRDTVPVRIKVERITDEEVTEAINARGKRGRKLQKKNNKN